MFSMYFVNQKPQMKLGQISDILRKISSLMYITLTSAANFWASLNTLTLKILFDYSINVILLFFYYITSLIPELIF